MNDIEYFLGKVNVSLRRGKINNKEWNNLFLVIDCYIMRMLVSKNFVLLKALRKLRHNAHNLYDLINE